MKIFKVIRLTFGEFRRDRAGAQAAALAYYAMFALAPMLLIAIGIGGLWLGEKHARDEIMGHLEGIIGEKSEQAVGSTVSQLSEKVNSVASIVVGLAVLFLAASGVFTQIHDSMNQMWGIEAKVHPIKGAWLFVRKRLLSFVLVLLSGLVMLASLASGAAVNLADQWLSLWLTMPPDALVLLEFVASLVLVGLFVTLILKYLADVAIAWRYALLGALLTSLLLNVGEVVFGIYLKRSLIVSAYGAAGSLIVLLIWLYYSGLIFYIGVEFTQVIAHLDGRPIRPSKWLK
ncbi:MAG: YihY/virulence factor BrkB family protein [Planctomycetota bacterium]